MSITDAGLRLVKHFEGLRLQAYVDPVGVWTLGWGHTANVSSGTNITVAEAEAFLTADLSECEEDVETLIDVTLDDGQLSALTSFVFNLGPGRLKTSTLRKKLNDGDVDGAANEFPRWVYGTVDGVKTKLPGLVRRRDAEKRMFLTGEFTASRGRADISPNPFLDEDLSDVRAAFFEGNGALLGFDGPNIPIALLGSHRELVVDMQTALADFGLLDPPADGVFGPVSSWALREFCRLNQLPLSSGFTEQIADALRNPSKKLPSIALSGTWIDAVISYMTKSSYWIGRHPEHRNIVYVEGVDPDGKLNDDRPNVFNDARIVFSIGNNGIPDFTVWEGTTEPGIFWTLNPMNPKGAARIAFGQYKSWAVGTHMSGSASAHEALVQVAKVRVHRDLNKDYKRTGDDVDEGLFGINQHWGYDSPKDDLGRSSAGCLVRRTKAGHRDFMDLIKEDPRYKANGGYRFIAAVLPGDKLELAAGARRRRRGGSGEEPIA